MSKKRVLYSYALLDELPLYFATIKRMEGKYKYISATERRCFNLISYYLPTIENMTSNSGLLLQYSEIVNYYVERGYLPPILVLDDIMVYGRGMAKFLDQLESLLYIELENRGYFDTDEKKYRFRRDFSRSIDIYVYARNAGKLLLADRFVKKLKCVKELDIRNLRDLSQQLSDYLRRKDIANTSYVCSFRNQMLGDILSQNIYEDVDEKHNWIRIPWNYEAERMVFYCRIYGNNTVNRISTIRLFPDRIENKSPRIISYTLIPPLEKSTLDELCKKLIKVLHNEKTICKGIERILSEGKSKYLQQNRGQIISFMLSLIDFYSFYNEEMQRGGKIVETPLYSDLRKIACNFGTPISGILKEFSCIAKNRDLLCKLDSETSKVLEDSKYCLMDIDPKRCIGSQLSYEDNNAINEIVNDVFYKVGLSAEKHAYDRYKASYIFSPDIYQESVEYNANNTITSEFSSFGSDGVITFSSFGKTLKEKHKEQFSCCFSEKFFGYIAAYVAMMDYGAMSNRVYYTTTEKVLDRKGNKLCMVAKAGEMALFHFPKQVAIFLPAFAKIEDRCHRIGMTSDEAVVHFYKMMYDLDYSEIFEQQDFDKWEKFKQKWPSKEKMSESTGYLYSSGQSFRNWFFPNLYYQEDEVMQRGQKYLYEKVLDFLLLPQESK